VEKLQGKLSASLQKEPPKSKIKKKTPQNLLRGDLANLSLVGSPDCVLPDASGKFFARF